MYAVDTVLRHRRDNRHDLVGAIAVADLLPPVVSPLMTIYLDNAATIVPQAGAGLPGAGRLRAAILANPGRAGHKMALAAEHALDDGRHRLNQLFHGKAPERFVFTLNCTDALNMAFKGVLRRRRSRHHDGPRTQQRQPAVAGDGTGRPHHADAAVRATAAARSIPTTVRTAITPEDAADRPDARQQRRSAPCSRSPRSGRIAREHDVLFLVDAAQTAGVIPVDVQAMHIDLLAFPGHKSLFGPTGTGACTSRRG